MLPNSGHQGSHAKTATNWATGPAMGLSVKTGKKKKKKRKKKKAKPVDAPKPPAKLEESK